VERWPPLQAWRCGGARTLEQTPSVCARCSKSQNHKSTRPQAQRKDVHIALRSEAPTHALTQVWAAAGADVHLEWAEARLRADLLTNSGPTRSNWQRKVRYRAQTLRLLPLVHNSTLHPAPQPACAPAGRLRPTQPAVWCAFLSGACAIALQCPAPCLGARGVAPALPHHLPLAQRTSTADCMDGAWT